MCLGNWRLHQTHKGLGCPATPANSGQSKQDGRGYGPIPAPECTAHTRAHTHHLPHPPGGPGDSCLPGLNLAPQRSHSAHQGTHLPFPASDNIGQGEENGVPGCLQGAPSLPNRAERLGSRATPRWHPASCSPLEFPPHHPGTLPSSLPRSDPSGQRDLPGPPPGRRVPPQVPAPVLRLTCLLPARQLSGWDLGVHLPHSPLLRKEEGAEEVLQRRAPGSGLAVKGTQEEGRVQSRSALHEGDPALLPRGGGAGTTDEAQSCQGRRKPWTLPVVLSGSTEHSRLCWGQGSQGWGWPAKPPSMYPRWLADSRANPSSVSGRRPLAGPAHPR